MAPTRRNEPPFAQPTECTSSVESDGFHALAWTVELRGDREPMTPSDFPKLWTATALYTVQGWSNEGPVRFSEPMPLQRALSIASQLNDQGYVHISLTDKDSGAQAPWHTFDFWNADSA